MKVASYTRHCPLLRHGELVQGVTVNIQIYKQELFDEFCLRMLFANNKVLRKYNIYPFRLPLSKTKILGSFNLLTLSVSDKSYSRNASCNLYLIFHYLYFVSHTYTTELLFKPVQIHA